MWCEIELSQSNAMLTKKILDTKVEERYNHTVYSQH